MATDNPSWLGKIQKTVRNIFQAVNFFQTPLNQSGTHYCFTTRIICQDRYNFWLSFASLDAARVRKEYDESSTKLSKLQSRISSLTQKLKHDFG